MNWNDPWEWTDRPPQLIGLEELGMEPCDGTGEDAMSMRVRNKWHRHLFMERQAAEHAAFGEWLYNQRQNHPDAQRLFAMWQQREELARRDKLPKEILVDVVNLFTRVELDGWNTISRKFSESIQCALPLRRVSYVSLTYFSEEISSSSIPELARLSGLFRATFTFNGQHDRKRLIASDIASLFTSFFGCLRFCCVESGIDLQHIPIGRAFLDNLKAINKDFRITATFDTCKMSNVSFTEGVNPYAVITSFPSFRQIAVQTLASLVKHVGALDDALVSSLAARRIWNVWIPDAEEDDRWAKVLHEVGGSRITEDGVLDFAFGAYKDDEEGRALHVALEVPLTPRFFEKLAQACRNHKRVRKTEVIITTCCDFDISAWNPKEIPRRDEYRRRQWEHRPISEFHFDDVPELTVQYVRAGRPDEYLPAGRIRFWRNGAPTLSDLVLWSGSR